MAAEFFVQESARHPRRKKIVLCCDGTGNAFSAPNPDPANPAAGRNSNVVKLYTALQVDNDQVAYYHPGVGTMGAPSAQHWWSREWTKIKGLAFGAGFRDNVLDAYRYLMEVYHDNGGDGNQDEVYIFGFSRGAYTARALAGLLHGYGLLCKGNEGHLAYAWRMYVAQHDERGRSSVQPDEAFKETFSHRGFRIHFVGVWDTVSSVGWISTPLRLFNLAQNDTILRIRHAVSIDEHRCFFQDNLFGKPTPGQDLVQVWFAGVHSDVGGSYPQPETGLSDITLRWMLAEAGILPEADGTYPDRPGIRLNPERLNLVFGIAPTPPAKSLLLYDPPTSSKLHKSLTPAWWLPEAIPHLFYSLENSREQSRVPLGMRLRQLPAGALVHASVAKRMDDASYRYAPRNVSRQELTPCHHTMAVAADGTRYDCFHPHNRKPAGALFTFFDRFVLTTLFLIFDLAVLLPVIVFLLLAVVGSAVVLLAKLLLLLWWLALHYVPLIVHVLVAWLNFLRGCLLHLLHWLWHLGLR